jgi:HKD family nuclease
MANPRFILQGIRKNNDHETAIRTFLELGELERVIFGVAFVRASGVNQISDFLATHHAETVVYAGIRNGVTSAQGLLALYSTQSRIYTVDTGSTSTIFHPKAYISFNSENARIIVGSANLTLSGLGGNIEGSTLLSIDRQEEADEVFLQDLVSSISSLQDHFPEHVVEIRRKSDISKLLKQGRLEDETVARPRKGNPQISARDSLPRIKLFKNRGEKLIPPPKRRVIHLNSTGWILVWVSKGLTERDLNIPSGANTNPTGSMLLKKGKIEGIDQRSYFREAVFGSIRWENDPNPSSTHLQRAEAEFEVVIKGLNYGVRTLKLTHNTRTDTRSYEQLNAMTQVHWGTAREIIAHGDLLGRELRLYKNLTDRHRFLIEID